MILESPYGFQGAIGVEKGIPLKQNFSFLWHELFDVGEKFLELLKQETGVKEKKGHSQ